MKKSKKTAVVVLNAVSSLACSIGGISSAFPLFASATSEESPILHGSYVRRHLISTSQTDSAANLILSDLELLDPNGMFTLSRTLLIHDFVGNEFVFAEFSPLGYGIYNVNNGDIIESAPVSVSPIYGIDGDFYYVPWHGIFEKTAYGYMDVSTKEMLTEKDFLLLENFSSDYSSTVSKQTFEENIKAVNLAYPKAKSKPRKAHSTNNSLSSGIIYADTEVPYSWYFKLNTLQFPENDGDDCGYVAASMLLAYNEIFNSTGYFSATQASGYITPYVGSLKTGWSSTNSTINPGGVPNLVDSFPHDIWGENIGSSFPSDIDNAINLFMSGKGKNYEIYDYVSIFANAHDPIKDGCPAALFGSLSKPDENSSLFHTVVAYGSYDNGRILCHFGWDYNSQVVMSELGITEVGGVVAIYNKSAHIHNKYFVDSRTGHKYCGCGALVEC